MSAHETTVGSATRRCPGCAARNRADARWCSLCHEPFGGPSSTSSPSSPPPPPPALAGAPPVATNPPPPPGIVDASRGSADEGRFRRTADGLEWACRRCGEWTHIDTTRCGACGGDFHALLDDPAPSRPDVADWVLLVSSLALPGSGHWRLGRRGIGGGIVAMYLLFVGGSVALLGAAGGRNQGVAAVAPLVLGAVVLLLGSALDAVNLGRGSPRTLLDSRMLLWLTVVVFGLVTMLFLVTALSVPGTVR